MKYVFQTHLDQFSRLSLRHIHRKEAVSIRTWLRLGSHSEPHSFESLLLWYKGFELRALCLLGRGSTT
jgi:hypothetical protein